MNQKQRIGIFLLACGTLLPQNLSSPNENTSRMAAGAMPIYRVTVTERTVNAINYQHRGGSTKVDFRGTELLPAARGEAKVKSKQGYIEIKLNLKDLQAANKLGSEYLTYVLWAITPQGRASNLGEILLRGSGSSLDVTTELQVFGLIVTAEPYFSVTRPSDLIVMENVVRADTKGKIEVINAKYELLQRGQYERLANPLSLKLDPKVPLELYEARNAVQIARAMGADRFASETFEKAETSLAAAEAYQARKAGRKPVTMIAREAVQTAEDARAIATQRQEDAELAAERQQTLDRAASAELAQQKALSELDRVAGEAASARQKSEADAARVAREYNEQAAAASAEADRARNESAAKLRAAASEAARLQIENDNRTRTAQMEADRLSQENEARIARAEAEFNRLKLENEAQRAAAQLALDTVSQRQAQLEAEKAELRIQLLRQFNAVLQTRDSARGLILNMPDVLFDSGKYELRPAAREKLAKVAGIVSSHPGLQLQVEGHTDSVGGGAYNQKLSEQRGEAVRDYLIQGGLTGASITSKGFGETQPVATNYNEAGRQENRRVELVISGELIGANIGTLPAANVQ